MKKDVYDLIYIEIPFPHPNVDFSTTHILRQIWSGAIAEKHVLETIVRSYFWINWRGIYIGRYHDNKLLFAFTLGFWDVLYLVRIRHTEQMFHSNMTTLQALQKVEVLAVGENYICKFFRLFLMSGYHQVPGEDLY